MNQQTLSQIIEAGQPVPITVGLMSAARESAHRQRSEALKAGFQWIHCRVKAATTHKLNSLTLEQQLTTSK